MTQRHTRLKKVARSERKERVTVTLSRRSAEYVRVVSAREQSHVSTVMEQLIESARHAEERKKLDAEISDFYDQLPDAAVREDAAWGEVGAAGLAAFVETEGEQAASEPTPKTSAR
jgi:hypothetical protein